MIVVLQSAEENTWCTLSRFNIGMCQKKLSKAEEILQVSTV
jgi:hypothetical protein